MRIIKIIGSIVLFILLFVENTSAAEIKYKIADIPANLKENAKIVVRSSVIDIQIKDSKATENHKLVISILNKNGKEFSVFNEMTSMFVSISDFHYTIYDSEGIKVKSHYITDLIDHSNSQGSLFADSRSLYLDPEYYSYPFTVEISFKKKIESLLFLSDWHPYIDYNCSVESASYKLNIEGLTDINYLEQNLSQKGIFESDKEGKHYTWKVENLLSITKEDFTDILSEYTPTVYVSPKRFKIEDSIGDFSSWQDFGKWYYYLIQDRNAIPPTTIEKIKALTNGLSPKEQIYLVYKYMQEHTRYVSIQIGIGGWQPFDAGTVDRLGYGDCKALSNYMSALLNCINIPSYQVLINAGKNPLKLKPEFPSNVFNHVILMVPLKNDTVYLECTSPDGPPNYLGKFTDNRYGLMINENGGTLIKTKSYTQKENLISSETQVNINVNGKCNAKFKTTYNGQSFGEIKALSQQTNDEIRNELFDRLNIPNFIIKKYEYTQNDKSCSTITEDIDVDIENYCSKMGNKVYFPLNINRKATENPIITDTRKSEIIITRHTFTQDTIYFTIPVGYVVEKIPEEKIINSNFGSYFSKCSTEGNKIIYIRSLILSPVRLSIDYSTEFKNFFMKVNQSDMGRITLVPIKN